MNYELLIIVIYALFFAIIALFIFLYIKRKSRMEKEYIKKEFDYNNPLEDSDEDSLANYENVDDYIILPSKTRNDSNSFDSIDDFLNNFSFRDEDYQELYEDVKVNRTEEVVNILIGQKAYIFLANGNKLYDGEKIVLRIDDHDYNGVIVKSNYERDLSSLKTEPKPLYIVKIIS